MQLYNTTNYTCAELGCVVTRWVGFCHWHATQFTVVKVINRFDGNCSLLLVLLWALKIYIYSGGVSAFVELIVLLYFFMLSLFFKFKRPNTIYSRIYIACSQCIRNNCVLSCSWEWCRLLSVLLRISVFSLNYRLKVCRIRNCWPTRF